jgi:acetyl-CoA synthetase
MTGEVPGDTIYQQILDSVTKEIGPHAKPDRIHFTPSLPKTRSGKIMRRILRKISEGDFEDLGDITTLADPGIVKDIISSLK